MSYCSALALPFYHPIQPLSPPTTHYQPVHNHLPFTTAVCSLLVMMAFGEENYTGTPERAFCVLVLLMIYGASSTALSYVMSFMFNNHSAAQVCCSHMQRHMYTRYWRAQTDTYMMCTNTRIRTNLPNSHCNSKCGRNITPKPNKFKPRTSTDASHACRSALL